MLRLRHGLGLGVILVSASCFQVLGLGEYRNGDAGGAASSATISTGQTGTGSGGGASSCTPGQSYPCYSGMAGTEGVGMCHAGTHVCDASGIGFGGCSGEQLPQAEVCSTKGDEDCDGGACSETIWANGISGRPVVAIDASGPLGGPQGNQAGRVRTQARRGSG